MRSAGSAQLVRRALDWDLSPADVLRRVRADPHPVALLGAWAGGSDIVASDPVRTCCAPEPCTELLDEPLPDLAGSGSGSGSGFGAGAASPSGVMRSSPGPGGCSAGAGSCSPGAGTATGSGTITVPN
jgi:hypothetical protein